MLRDPFSSETQGGILQEVGYEIQLERRRVGELELPEGRLIGCDLFAYPETEPFEVELPDGTFAAYAVLAHLRDRREVAFIAIEFSDEVSTRWSVAHVGEEAIDWRDAHTMGFATESGVAALMDETAATHILDLIGTEDGEEEFRRKVHRTLSRARRGPGYGVGQVDFDTLEANAIVFELDDGVYPAYVGAASDGTVLRFVIDLGVVDLDFTPFGIKQRG